MFNIRELSINTGRGGKIWVIRIIFGPTRGVDSIFQIVKGGLNFFHASLANIFNK